MTDDTHRWDNAGASLPAELNRRLYTHYAGKVAELGRQGTLPL